MKQSIRGFFDTLLPLDNTEWDAMEQKFQLVRFNKGDVLLKEGDICDFIGFMNEGIVHFYHIKEGNEKVTAFWFQGDFLSNYRSFVSKKPSDHYIQALTDGHYWALKQKDLYALYDNFPRIDRLGRLMAERLYLMVSSRLDKFLQETPEERYNSLLTKNSRLIHEIPQYMIASYLGVSAETLSRIRKRMAMK